VVVLAVAVDEEGDVVPVEEADVEIEEAPVVEDPGIDVPVVLLVAVVELKALDELVEVRVVVPPDDGVKAK